VRNRPDYVNCVLTGRYILDEGPGGPRKEERAWCGRDVAGEWTFVDASHAALNGNNEGRLVACPDCVRRIHAALARNEKVLPDLPSSPTIVK